MQRYPASRTSGITWRHRNDQVGSPCRNSDRRAVADVEMGQTEPVELAVATTRTGSRAARAGARRGCGSRRSSLARGSVRASASARSCARAGGRRPPGGSGRRPRSRGRPRRRSRGRTATRLSSGRIGSPSPQMISLGRGSEPSAASTRWPVAAPAICGVVGRISGKRARAGLRRRVRERRARRRRSRSPAAAPCTRRGSGTTPAGPRCAGRARGMPATASVIFWWPVNRPVSSTTMRPIRSGCSTATRSPIGPPQSCTTIVASRSLSSANSAATLSVWRS